MILFLETATPTDPLAFVQYGILGVILLMLLTGWLWAKPAVDEMQKRHREERELLQSEILPLLQTLAKLLEENNRLLVDLRRSRERNQQP